MIDYLNCYDKNRKKVAILNNAYEIEEDQELNSPYTLKFNMPGDDQKLEYIKPFCYTRWNDDGQLYRVVKRSSKQEEVDTVSIECEHVIMMLCNDIMYGEVKYGGETFRTSSVIEYLLSQQKTKNWVLGGCDFDRRFEYTWKHENIYNALFRIPTEFAEDYMWDYETTVYPWRLYLRRLSKDIYPEFYVRAERNLIGCSDDFDWSTIYTRIYPLGADVEYEAELTPEEQAEKDAKLKELENSKNTSQIKIDELNASITALNDRSEQLRGQYSMEGDDVNMDAVRAEVGIIDKSEIEAELSSINASIEEYRTSLTDEQYNIKDVEKQIEDLNTPVIKTKPLDISEINNGKAYVEASAEDIEKYGLVEIVMIDNRYTDVNSLKAYGESTLKNALDPSVSRSFDVVDLYPLTNSSIDKAHVGALTRLTMDGSTVYITKTSRVLDEPGNLKLDFSTRAYTVSDQIGSAFATVQNNLKYS